MIAAGDEIGSAGIVAGSRRRRCLLRRRMLGQRHRNAVVAVDPRNDPVHNHVLPTDPVVCGEVGPENRSQMIRARVVADQILVPENVVIEG